MTKRMVRIEEVFVSPEGDFSPNVWIESDTLQYADTTICSDEAWVVVEVKEVDNNG